MRLFIAEKPSVARDLAQAIASAPIQNEKGYIVAGDDVFTYGIGHLLTQAQPEEYDSKYEKWVFQDLPMVPEKFKMLPSREDGRHQQLKTIGKLLKDAAVVMHCGDAAREGQAIVDEILEYFGYRGPVQRMWIQEMSKSGIRRALATAETNKKRAKLYEAAKARAQSDWLLGLNLTRGYSLAYQVGGGSGPIHVGRVSTPTMCIVVQREKDIQVFVPVDHYSLTATVVHPKGEFAAKFQPAPGSNLIGEHGLITDKGKLKAIQSSLLSTEAVVVAISQKENKSNPPLPYSLGEMQKDANRLLGLKPKQTLDVLQGLYEKHKLTSYPRTNSQYMPTGEHSSAQGFIDAAKSNFTKGEGGAWPWAWFSPDYGLKSPAWNDSKIDDHHGIRPTDRTGYDLSQLSKHELIIYKLIVERFLMQFSRPYQYISTTATLQAGEHALKATGKVEKDKGWREFVEAKSVFGQSSKSEREADSDKDAEGDIDQRLPPLAQSDKCRIDAAKIDAKKTSAPSRFTGADLIDAMERAHLFVSNEQIKKLLKDAETGIGTPATRAQIIEDLERRQYLAIQKKGKREYYFPTEKAFEVFSVMPPLLKTPDLTAYFEEMLRKVELGELEVQLFMKQQTQFVESVLLDLKKKYFTDPAT